MQNAPSVVYPVGRSTLLMVIQAALGLLALLAGALAAFTMHAGLWFGLVFVCVWTAWALWAWRFLREDRGGCLHWHAGGVFAPDGQTGHWRWRRDLNDTGVQVDRVEPVLDLQSAWLLRLDGGAEVPRWVCVEARRQPADWSALRRALMAVQDLR